MICRIRFLNTGSWTYMWIVISVYYCIIADFLYQVSSSLYPTYMCRNDNYSRRVSTMYIDIKDAERKTKINLQ